MTQVDLEPWLVRIQAALDLESDLEREVLDEVRFHLEQAVAEGVKQGLSAEESLAQALDRFGVQEDVGAALQQVHMGEATADAVLACALPVAGALVLRWLIYAPGGTALAWPMILGRFTFWSVALAAGLVPLLTCSRRRSAVAVWSIFWGLTVLFVTKGVLQW